ncbi:MAG: hemin-degrading factor [Pseudomonadales bacterium]
MQSLQQLFQATTQGQPTALAQKYSALMASQPKLRRRDAAQALGVSEAQLLEANCDVQAQRLQARFDEIIYDLPSLGYIMTLTRNESAVHERKGTYSNISIKGPMGLVITDDRKIDLRIVINRWHSGFAVCESLERGERYSLHFFDAQGVAIQKIYLQQESDLAAFAVLIEKYRELSPQPLIAELAQEEPAYVSDAQVDREQLVNEWREMRNVHQFFGLLKKHKVAREQAFRLAGSPLAQPFDPALLQDLLERIAKTDLSIMCFVGNRGNIQIHTGAIDNVKVVGDWLNILDPEFNLHLRQDRVASAWLVRKPSADGDITSIELYDAEGETIAQFFGQRVEGNPENKQWRAFAESLLEEAAVA